MLDDTTLIVPQRRKKLLHTVRALLLYLLMEGVTADTATFKSGVVEPALTDYSRHSMAEKREQVLARIVAAIDGAAMVVILTAILLQLRNADNWIFLLNLPHTCWWLVTLIIAGTLPSRAWFNVYIVMTASWFLLDVGSFIWRAILLHSCLHSSHSHSCRDFLLQSWFVIASNAVFLLTTICCLVLAVLLQKHSFQDRLHAHQEERRYAKLVQSTY